MQAHRINTTVASDRSVTLRDLPFEEGEELEVILLQRSPHSASAARSPREQRREGTAKDLAHSPLAGLWKGRDDIGSSQEFARRLREEAQHRSKRREEGE